MGEIKLDERPSNNNMTMDYGGAAASGGGSGSVMKIVSDLAKGSKMPTVNKVHWSYQIYNVEYLYCLALIMTKVIIFRIVSFKDVLNNHVTRLQNSVGLTCGTVQEVSNKHLQVNEN